MRGDSLSPAQATGFFLVCHCRTCRGISGAPVFDWVSVGRADFAVLQGTPKTYRYPPGIERQFCGDCGTQLSYAAVRHTDWIDVATASLDNPSAFPPTHHSGLSHTIRWVRFGDGLPAFPARGRVRKIGSGARLAYSAREIGHPE